MLKRYQVLLTDWLGEHLATISHKYDISFSEAVRLALCLQIPKLASIAYPKLKATTADKKMVSLIRKHKRNKGDRIELHKLFSEIYFEARKTVEAWTAEEQKRTKKKQAVAAGSG